MRGRGVLQGEFARLAGPEPALPIRPPTGRGLPLRRLDPSEGLVRENRYSAFARQRIDKLKSFGWEAVHEEPRAAPRYDGEDREPQKVENIRLNQ